MSILVGDNFSYSAQKPLDGRLKYDTLADMIAVGDSTMYDGCLAYCVATDKTYQWKSTNEVDPTLRKWREFTSGGNIQLEELPEASADELNNIYMYMGDDDSTEGLVHAHFYQCVSDGGSPATYSWKDMGYQKIYVGSSSDWDLLTTAEKTVYDEAHFTDDEPFSAPDIYSTSEVKTNKVWIDGKPIYRKVFKANSVADIANQWKTLQSVFGDTLSNVDSVVESKGIIVSESRNNAAAIGWLAVSNDGYMYYYNTIINRKNNSPVTVIVEYTKTTDG